MPTANSSASKEAVTAALLVIASKSCPVMAGVPSIMQAMLDEVAPKLKIGVRMFSETVRADAREGDIGMQFGEIATANPEVANRRLSVLRSTARAQHECSAVRPRCTEARAGQVEEMLERVRRAQSKSA